MIVCIDDLHAKEIGPHKWLTDLKLENLAKVFDQWKERADRFAIKGDFFHVPNPSHELVARCVEPFKRLGEHIVKVVFMPGNHDPIMKHLSAITSFAKGTQINGTGMKVVTADEPYFDHEVKACFCAWSKDELPKALASDWDFYGHIQVRDWIKFSEHGHTLDEIKSMGFRRAYLGDYHPFRDDGKVVSVGTFGTSDFNDEGLKSGYIVSESNGSFKRYVFDYPVFKTIEIRDECGLSEHFLSTQSIKGDIIRVKLYGEDRELTNELVERVRMEVSKFEPLRLASIDKIYAKPEVQMQKQSFLNLDELITRHQKNWPTETVEEYENL